MRYFITLVLFGFCLLLAQSDTPSLEQQSREYYSQWVGVRAPEFPSPLTDRRDDGKMLRIRDFRGKRLLLFSFDAGDFVDGPRDEGALIEQLTALREIKEERLTTNVAVIGFTYGPAFFMPGVDNPSYVTNTVGLPVVNNNSLRRTPLPEPYHLLQRWPSLVVIDKYGTIVRVCSPPLARSNTLEALSTKDWSAPLRSPPAAGPPEAVKSWSSRNFWVIFAYTKDLAGGTTFRREFGRMKRVYVADDVPGDEIGSLKSVDGLMLRKGVKSGSAIRKSDFEQR
jgi:hypothetical protein